MQFITQDMLVEPMLKSILTTLHKDYQNEVCEDDNISFDTWLWKNLNFLGEELYLEIGQRYGDCDDAMEELK